MPLPDCSGQKPILNKNLVYLNISGPYDDIPIKMEIENSFNSDRMSFWASLNTYENIDGFE